MKDMHNALSNCILMKNFSENEIKSFLEKVNYTFLSYSKGEIIAIEESNCSKIGIITSGTVEVQKIFSSGKVITIGSLKVSDIFGEVIIFSNRNTYPATITASSNADVMFISKEDILKLCNLFPVFLNNFMSLLSNKILMLNKKLKNISYETLRQKIASYILDEYSHQKKLDIILNYTRKEMAEQLGIPRPSLSRELVNMKKDNLIDFSKNHIIIKNVNNLEKLLF
ncbi:MAG: Crp/Fnr family transcriptional regulator [Clostridium luticellarii]|jgi:CRP-like cAMP-binding protein|uniref:cAMP-activated global transcriptional regulator CRP n=1 Tax=Clostridium luticellarii TaxID=1691940 RepID=A0A2T0BN85_9CLOT|nr:Crp/Fnr family transcriptional regulator [Clostridium luticellarii]MCI1996539.1 Crp/Fnr family transcriptional regulator [Clostridium luticellarii]MCI2039808.1 Crp/Fnr family transcriptional regulator [Clostridium luticellarii]PRR85327.1 cAMP-activated global transcriptional regulator CRP [Clostridium luticellarii]